MIYLTFLKNLIKKNKTNSHLLDAIFIFLFAIVLRFMNLEHWPRIFGDEGGLGVESFNLLDGVMGSKLWGPNFFPPLYEFLVAITSTIVGNGTLAVRLPSALMGSISVILLYFIVLKTYNRHMALLSSILLSFSTVYINRIGLYHNAIEFFLLTSTFLYIKLNEENSTRWSYLLGISLGLGLLSHHAGVAALIFIVIISIVDGRFYKIRISLFIAGFFFLYYPILGFIYNWQWLIDDLFFVYHGVSTFDMDGLLKLLIMGRPVSQMAMEGTLRFNIYSTIGFFSLFYLLGRKDRGDKLFLILFISLLPILVIRGSYFWWSYLVYVYPMYSVGIAAVLYDLYTKNDYLLGIFTFFLTLPLFTYEYLPNELQGKGLLLFLILFVSYIGALFINHTHLSKYASVSFAVRILPLTILIITIAGYSTFELANITTNEGADQLKVAEFLNNNVTKDDMVATSENLLYLLKDNVGVSYAHVALFTTKIEFKEYTLRRIPRYHKDISIDKMKYFVLDTPVYGFTPWVDHIIPYIKYRWIPVYASGDYKVYMNPKFKTKKSIIKIFDAESTENFSVEDSPGNISLNIVDKQQGDASIEAKFVLGNSFRANLVYTAKDYWNIYDAENTYIFIDVKFDNSTWRDYLIGLRDISDRFRLWRFDYNDQGKWTKLYLSFNDYFIEDKGFDQKKIKKIYIGVYDKSKIKDHITIQVDEAFIGRYSND